MTATDLIAAIATALAVTLALNGLTTRFRREAPQPHIANKETND